MKLPSVAVLYVACAVACLGTDYYISTTGNDANDGLSTSTPWEHCPYMPTWTGTHSHSPGDTFIFRGGETWSNENFSLIIPAANDGTAGNPVVLTSSVDWYAGASWSRPIFDGGGSALTNFASGRGNMIRVDADYVNVENLEITNFVVSTNTLSYCTGVQLYSADNCIVSNVYVHNWVVEYNLDGKFGGIQNGTASLNSTVVDCTVQAPAVVAETYRSSADGHSSGAGMYDITLVERCTIIGTTHGVFDVEVTRYSTIRSGGNSFDDAAHENGAWVENNGQFYNNVMHDWPQGIAIYCIPGWTGTGGRTNRIFNNLVYDVGISPISISENNNETNMSPSVAWIANNTLISDGSCIVYGDRPDHPPLDEVYIANNVLITDGATVLNITASNAVTNVTNNAYYTEAEAASCGMTLASLYEPSSGCATAIDAGTDLSAVFTVDISGDTRPSGSAWDIGAYEFDQGDLWPNVPDSPPNRLWIGVP